MFAELSTGFGKSLTFQVGHYVDVDPARPLVVRFEAAFIGKKKNEGGFHLLEHRGVGKI